MTTYSMARDIVDHLHEDGGVYVLGRTLFQSFIPTPGNGVPDGDPVLGVIDSPGEADFLSGGRYIEQPRAQVVGVGTDLAAVHDFVNDAVRTFTDMDRPGDPDAGDGMMTRTSGSTAPSVRHSYVGFWVVIPTTYVERDDLNRHEVTATIRCQRTKKEEG